MDMQEIKRLIYKGEKIDVECKKAGRSLPKSVYESYSGFANTNGGYIILGVEEDKKKNQPEERFIIQGIENAAKQIEDFWNTINSEKVNANILKDENVCVVEEKGISLIVIQVPRADYKLRPVYIGENPFKGTFKRNHEGDYHAAEYEVRGMIRDQNPDGNDSLVLEYSTMDDIDLETLRHYRKMFQTRNPEHVWNSYEDKEFLEALGGYRKNRRTGAEGLTLAGLLMFGKGLYVRDEFDNIFMDYRDESATAQDIRWNDRVTYDGTWENNLFNFYTKVAPRLMADLKKPFVLENQQRIDDTPVHKAVREAFVNLIIHSDYQVDAGTLKIIKYQDGFEFSNPGILKLPIEEIYKGGNSKSRNPRMQTMLRMVGFGDNAGSGFPAILAAWKKAGWEEPELTEDTILNQVTLRLSLKSAESAENAGELAENEEKSAESAERPEKSAEKSAESAENSQKSAEKWLEDGNKLSVRHRQILSLMEKDAEYSTEEVAALIGLKGPRTRQLLNELVYMGKVKSTAVTKNRRYIKR